MSNNNDMKTEVIIPGNEKNLKIFVIVYKGLNKTISCIITSLKVKIALLLK